MDSFAIVSMRIYNYNMYTGSLGLDGILYIFAVISFILSFILLFFGKRLFRSSLGIIGFLSFGSIPFWIGSIPFWISLLINNRSTSPTGILIIMLSFGAVAAFIVSYFTKFGIYIIGAATGVQFGFLLTEIIYPNSLVLFIILAILLGLAGLILPYFFMSYMVIGIITFNGFLLFKCAIQYVVTAGYMGRFINAKVPYDSGSYWGILFGSLFVGCLGAIWQYHKYKNYPYIKNMESNQTHNENV